MIENDPVIWEFYHESLRPRAAEALQILREVASLVEPIMRRREFKVGTLPEFWPEEEGLLGMNYDQGQTIFIRLRHARDEHEFLHIDKLVTCMLHELCHNIHYHHTKYFWQLFNLLQDEYTGETAGYNPEGSPSTNHEVQRHDRTATEENAADGCASGTKAERQIMNETMENGTRTKADEDNADEVAIMLAQFDLIEQEEREKYGDNPAGSQGTLADNNPTSDPLQSNDGSWLCKICTLVNPKNYLCCNACGIERDGGEVNWTEG